MGGSQCQRLPGHRSRSRSLAPGSLQASGRQGQTRSPGLLTTRLPLALQRWDANAPPIRAPCPCNLFPAVLSLSFSCSDNLIFSSFNCICFYRLMTCLRGSQWGLRPRAPRRASPVYSGPRHQGEGLPTQILILFFNRETFHLLSQFSRWMDRGKSKHR